MLSPCFKGYRIVLPRLVFAHRYYRQKGFLPKRRKPIIHPSQGIRLCRFLYQTKVGERGGVSEPSKRNQFRSTNKSLKHVWTKVKSKRSEGEESPMHLDLQKQNVHTPT
jgi:hypothetical protein